MESRISTHSILSKNPQMYSKYTTDKKITGGVLPSQRLVIDTQQVCRLFVSNWTTRSIIPNGYISNKSLRSLIEGPDSIITQGFPFIQFLMQNISSNFQESLSYQKNFTQGFTTFVFGAEPPVINFSGVLLNTYVDNWSEVFLSLYYYFLRASRLAEVSGLNNTPYQVVIKYQNKSMKGSIISLQKQTNAFNEQGVGFTFQFLMKELSFDWKSLSSISYLDLKSLDEEIDPLETLTSQTVTTTARMLADDINTFEESELLLVPPVYQDSSSLFLASNKYDGEMCWITPTSNRITSLYGEDRYTHSHAGIDIATPMYTPVVAADEGVVSQVAYNPNGYGNYIVITHPNGRQTLYAHLSTVNLAVGAQVTRGQSVALSGNTGRSTGPHVHFEVRENGATIDPRGYFSIPVSGGSA